MDKTWTWRDWIFVGFFLLIALLIVLHMVQDDRLYTRLNQLIEMTGEIKGRPAGPGAASTLPGENATTAHVPTGDWCIRNITEPATLNPIIAKDAYEGVVNQYVMEQMLDRNPRTLKLEPRLSESYEISPDKLRYTFHLRKDVFWHDGVPFTADDVVFSFEMLMHPKVDCENLRNYYEGVRVEKLDAHTVRFTSSKVYWKAFIMCGSMPIVAKHVFEKDAGEKFNFSDAGRAPVGTGPYKFGKWDAKQRIILERNPRYRDPVRAGHVDRIVFKFIIDETAEIEAVKKQEIDYFGCSSEQWVRDVPTPIIEKNFTRHKLDSPSFSYIGWNEKTPFFSDRRVRAALACAVPRDDFLKHRLNGLGKVVSGPFYVNSDAYDRSIEPLPYDLDKARRLLDDAGWKDTDGDGVRDRNGRPFKFQLLLASGRHTTEDLAIMVSAELRKIGVVMTIRGLDWASFIKEIDERNFEAVTLGWTLDLEEDPYQLWHSSQTGASGSNFVYFANPEADGLIEQSRTEFDESKRNVLFRRLHRILHEEQPYTFLFNVPSLLIVNNRFQNVIEYPLELELLDWWVPVNRQKYR